MAEKVIRRVLVDVDTGVDDAQALAVILAEARKKSTISLEGVTCVAGNVPVPIVVQNTCAVLEAGGAKGVGSFELMDDAELPPIPYPVAVARGASRPLCAEYEDARYWHGEDGLGNTGLGEKFAEKVEDFLVESSAARLISDLSRPASSKLDPDSEATSLDVLCLGPLTNLALALREDEGLADRLGVVYVMGGTCRARGNRTEVVEYNFGTDPEAAKIVVEDLGRKNKLVVVSWDICEDHPIPMDWLRSKWLRDDDDAPALSKLMRLISNHCLERAGAWSEDSLVSADPLAAAIFVEGLDSTLITSSSTRFVSVVTQGDNTTRGMLIADHRPTAIEAAEKTTSGSSTSKSQEAAAAVGAQDSEENPRPKAIFPQRLDLPTLLQILEESVQF